MKLKVVAASLVGVFSLLGIFSVSSYKVSSSNYT